MKTNDDLSPRQQAVYDYIVQFCEARSYPPTVREIGSAVGLKSTSNVHAHLKTLEKKGYIRMDSSRQRTISIVHSPMIPAADIINVPIVDAIAAGNPILAFEGIKGYIALSVSYLRGADVRDVFALEVEGESMLEAGIFSGDFVIVHRGLCVGEGDIGAARVSAVYGDAVTVKRIYRENGSIRLQCENSGMQPVIVPEASAELVGGVIGLYRVYS